MTVAELISELMKYGPMAEVKIVTDRRVAIGNVLDTDQGDIILITPDYERYD